MSLGPISTDSEPLAFFSLSVVPSLSLLTHPLGLLSAAPVPTSQKAEGGEGGCGLKSGDPVPGLGCLESVVIGSKREERGQRRSVPRLPPVVLVRTVPTFPLSRPTSGSRPLGRTPTRPHSIGVRPLASRGRRVGRSGPARFKIRG